MSETEIRAMQDGGENGVGSVPPEEEKPAPDRYDIASWVIVGVGLFLAIKLHLLMALLAGMLVFELVQALMPLLHLGHLQGYRAKVVAVAVLSTIIVALLLLAIFGLFAFLRSGSDSLPTLLKEMAAVLETSRDLLPPSLIGYLPSDVEDLQARAVAWLRSHAVDLQTAGREAMRGAAHALIGLVIGALVSLREAVAKKDYGPLARAMAERVDNLGNSFHRVVFAQVRIAAINTFFTWLYLAVALPLLGAELPLVKTLVAVTFVAGLLPVVGNLISNTVIVTVSLSWSVELALVSLGFLIIIHKLEYFLNAHIVGSRIRSSAWELLVAMVVMEAAFGLRGLVAAPIYYAYLKEELTARNLI